MATAVKNLFLILSISTVFAACVGNDISLSEKQSKENVSVNMSSNEAANKPQADFSFEKLVSEQNPSEKQPKWIAPKYKDLQLGKAVEKDVLKMFGRPNHEGAPDEVPAEEEWMFSYENIGDFDGRTEFLFDTRSKILKQVWLTPHYQRPLTIEKAIDIYGKDYLVRGENFCSSKTLTKLDYPFTIVYPQKGIYFWIREKNNVDVIFYTAKCPR